MPEPEDFPQNDEAQIAGAKLFAETIAAYGGDVFLQQRTLKITGKGEFTTPPQTGKLTIPLTAFTLYVATNGRSRLEARSPGGSVVFLCHGAGRGGAVLIIGRTLSLPAEQADGIEVNEFLRSVARHRYPVFAIPMTTPEITADGATLLRYDVCPENGRATQVYVDAETKLVRKTFTITTRGEMTVLLSAYQSVADVAVPGEIQLLENGERVIKLIASEVVIDSWIDDKLFERP